MLLGATQSSAQEDMEGASDHPEIPRIAGSIIAGYGYASFDEVAYLEGTDEDLVQNYAAGEVTKLLYLLPPDQSSTAAFLNYQEAFEELGEFEPYYSCRRGRCDPAFGKNFVWRQENRFETNIRNLNTYFFNYKHLYQNQVYLAGQLKAESGTYLVSVFAAETTRDRPEFVEGQTLVVLQVVKTEEFESDLEVVAADEIGAEINASGHVALNGLFFETDKDVLESASKPALDEIANFLTLSPEVNVYVVGHTDNVGDVAYNQDLSQRRAASIVSNLVDEYGIDAGRITALGAGLAAPVATNKTEDGRALNRRVELVER